MNIKKKSMLSRLYLILTHLVSYIYFRINPKISVSSSIRIKGRPLVTIKKNSRIEIGKNVLLNSSNREYHLNMHSPCKLLADGEESVIIIGNNCRIHGTCIHATNKITIGDNCLIAANTQIIDSNAHLLSMDNPADRINTIDKGQAIKIGNNVWIGANVIILPGISIGDGSVIGAGSLVSKSIPAKTVAGGNPIKIIKSYQ